jgi:hypothetical protein
MNLDAPTPPQEGPPSEDEADRKAMLRFVWWLAAWAILGGGFLVFSIWVDWAE